MATKKKPASNKRSSQQPRKSQQSPRSIVVTVADDHLAEIQSVAKQLRSRGMTVDGVLESIGIISGSSDTDAEKLRSIPGVLGVEEQTQFQVPPPDAPVK